MKPSRRTIIYLVTVFIAICIAFFIYEVIAGYKISPVIGFGPYDEQTQKVRGTTWWDWLDLLVVPVTLSIGIWFLERSERKSDQLQQEDRQRQGILDSYFDFMTELMTRDDFISNDKVNNKYKSIIRTRTLVALANIDGGRKGNILQFLVETSLLNKSPQIDLGGADFKDADLDGAGLQGVELRGVHFDGAMLTNANLDNADLRGCVFTGANLSDTHLDHTNLQGTVLCRAKIKRVDLRSTNIQLALLEGVDLTGSTITDKQQAMLSATHKVIYPNGTRHS